MSDDQELTPLAKEIAAATGKAIGRGIELMAQVIGPAGRLAEAARAASESVSRFAAAAEAGRRKP